MPDDRRAWHRGGACLFIVNLLRRGRTTWSRENSMCRVPRCAGVRRGHAALKRLENYWRGVFGLGKKK
jgi:hypothetical protein